MKNFYEVGRVYVWQNLVDNAHMNGQETTVTTDAIQITGAGGLPVWVQGTDTPNGDGRNKAALPGQLRPKNPPPGEQLVRDMFKLPELEPA